MPVRSKILFGPVALTSPVSAEMYLCDSSETALAKSIDLVSDTALSDTVTVFLSRGGPNNQRPIYRATVPGMGHVHSEAFRVCGPGDRIFAARGTAVGNIWLTVYGAELEGFAD